MGAPAETRVCCSKEARTMLARHKDAEHTTYDDVIRKLVRAYEREDKD